MSAAATIGLVTPNLNYAKSLARTLDSVLGQNYPRLDYLVIDDGSTDGSREILERYQQRGLRWEPGPQRGQYPALNHGLARVAGDILGWINSDDILLPWTLRTVAEIFTAFPEVEWVMGAPAVIQDDAVVEVAPVRPLLQEALALGLYSGGNWGLVQQESCFWRRGLWERAGALREDLAFAADFELWTRFAQHAELTTCSAVLGGFTVHATNRSRVNSDRYAADVAHVVDALAPSDRRRRRNLQRAHDRYLRWRRIPGVKGFVRRLDGLAGRDGPVLRRDVAANRFVLGRELVFP